MFGEAHVSRPRRCPSALLLEFVVKFGLANFETESRIVTSFSYFCCYYYFSSCCSTSSFSDNGLMFLGPDVKITRINIIIPLEEKFTVQHNHIGHYISEYGICSLIRHHLYISPLIYIYICSQKLDCHHVVLFPSCLM